ncbi:DsbE family thiol:disulfide interchange protein [Halocynthiibacter namhaensis]|uniref:DsbE family thiol:disulfide interchange protein n=1 Tax=Halocynthiibacter namhaensis TaxID=1290553 RepID=UPI000B1350EE|nr:DsbE family thiol:disulfide interchange protein [Halocynthiibacter namhaensis]
MKFNPVMALPPAIFGGFLIFAFLGLGGEKTFEGRQGVIAPEMFVEPLADLPEIKREDLTTGGVKLVNFWASWCAPCRAEHPNLELLRSEGMAIYGVNYKDDPQNALGFLAELGNPYAAIGADASARTALEWGVAGVPETFILDGEGRIVQRFAGPITQRTLDAIIRPALARAADQN